MRQSGSRKHKATGRVVPVPQRLLSARNSCRFSMGMGSCFYPMTRGNEIRVLGSWAIPNIPFLRWVQYWLCAGYVITVVHCICHLSIFMYECTVVVHILPTFVLLPWITGLLVLKLLRLSVSQFVSISHVSLPATFAHGTSKMSTTTWRACVHDGPMATHVT